MNVYDRVCLDIITDSLDSVSEIKNLKALEPKNLNCPWMKPENYIKTQRKKFLVTIRKTKDTILVFDHLDMMKYNLYLNSFIVTDPLDEEFTATLEEVCEYFIKKDGTPITEGFLKLREVEMWFGTEFFEIIKPFKAYFKPSERNYWAYQVPMGQMFELSTYLGRRMVNHPKIEHGSGDYIVCPDKNGQPLLELRILVNGLRFEKEFNMKPFKKCRKSKLF